MSRQVNRLSLHVLGGCLQDLPSVERLEPLHTLWLAFVRLYVNVDFPVYLTKFSHIYG